MLNRNCICPSPCSHPPHILQAYLLSCYESQKVLRRAGWLCAESRAKVIHVLAVWTRENNRRRDGQESRKQRMRVAEGRLDCAKVLLKHACNKGDNGSRSDLQWTLAHA
jgi:hypothetical protein